MQREAEEVILLKYDMHVYTAWVAEDEAAKCGFELQSHHPYSQDFAPSFFIKSNQ